MEHIPGYDEWKTRAPSNDGGSHSSYSRTRMEWWRMYRRAKDDGYGDEWLQAQRDVPAVASFVREADAHNARHGK